MQISTRKKELQKKGETMDNRKENKQYTEIGQKLIESEPIFEHIKNSGALICFLESDKKMTSKGKAVLGQCEKVQDKYKWAIPCDFTITLFTPNIAGLTDEQIKIVIFHELLHIGVEKIDDGTGYYEEKYTIVPHDLEDFKEVIDRYGTNWAERKI